MIRLGSLCCFANSQLPSAALTPECIPPQDMGNPGAAPGVVSIIRFRVPTTMFSSALLHFPSGISDVQANKVASWSQIKEAEVLVERTK